MKLVVVAALGLLGAAAQAQDRADLERTQIIGNRELPKVLYIVPWKKPLPGQLLGRPVQSVLDEALAPVDRAVFRRQVEYGGQVQAQLQAQALTRNPSKSDAPPGAPPATPTERR